MNYVTAEDLTKSYGLKVLFKNISFNVNEGDKIAIVAKNGSGKSTLLKILMGKEIADSGTVVINKDIQVVLFDQEIEFDSALTVEEFMMTLDSAPIVAVKNYHHALHTENPDDMEKQCNILLHKENIKRLLNHTENGFKKIGSSEGCFGALDVMEKAI